MFGTQAWLLGDAMISTQYLIFDYENGKVGMIEANDTAGSTDWWSLITTILLRSLQWTLGYFFCCCGCRCCRKKCSIDE